MADEKLSRFRVLEKSRNQPVAGQATPAPSARFGVLEKKVEAGGTAAASSSSLADRFGPQAAVPPRNLEDLQQAAQAPSGLELEQVNPADQPFVRCVRCEADNNAWSTSCQQCGTLLDTDEQRTFNERLWARRRAEKEQEEQALAEARKAQAAPGMDPGLQREVAERMAQEVAQATRERLDGQGMSSGWSTGRLGYRDHGYGGSDFIARLFESLSPGLRTALIAIALGVPLVMTAFQRTRSLGFIGFLLVGALLLRLWIAS